MEKPYDLDLEDLKQQTDVITATVGECVRLERQAMDEIQNGESLYSKSLPNAIQYVEKYMRDALIDANDLSQIMNYLSDRINDFLKTLSIRDQDYIFVKRDFENLSNLRSELGAEIDIISEKIDNVYALQNQEKKKVCEYLSKYLHEIGDKPVMIRIVEKK